VLEAAKREWEEKYRKLEVELNQARMFAVVRNTNTEESEKSLGAEAQRLREELQQLKRTQQEQQRKFLEEKGEHEGELRRIREETVRKLRESAEEREKEIQKLKRQNKEKLARVTEKSLQEKAQVMKKEREQLERHLEERKEMNQGYLDLQKKAEQALNITAGSSTRS